jgi:hypothetical protein
MFLFSHDKFLSPFYVFFDPVPFSFWLSWLCAPPHPTPLSSAIPCNCGLVAGSVKEVKSVVVHFQGKAFNSDHLLEYQLADVGREPADKGT